MVTISELPYELLGIIFDYLTFRDKLSAGAVCKRWNEVLQVPYFQEQRRYRLENNQQNIAYLESQLALASSSIGHWKRLHVNNKYASGTFCSITQTVEMLLRNGILSPSALEMEYDRYYNTGELHTQTYFQIIDALEGIEELSIIFRENVVQHQSNTERSRWKLSKVKRLALIGPVHWIPFTLEDRCLRSLELTVNSQEGMKLLRSCASDLVELTVSFIDRHWKGEFLAVCLPNIQRLRFYYNDYKKYDMDDIILEASGRDFIDAAANLSHLTSNDKWLYDCVCEYALKTLKNLAYVEMRNFLVAPVAFAAAIANAKSQNLELKICFSTPQQDVEFQPVTIPSLTKLMCRNDIFLRHHIFPNLHTLHLQPLRYEFGAALDEVFRNCKNLQVLTLSKAKIYSDTIESLSQLSELRVIRLQMVRMKKFCWSQCDEMPGVTKLIFQNFIPRRTTLCQMKRIFTHLKRLHIYQCCFGNTSEDSIRDLFHDAIISFNNISIKNDDF